MKNIIAIAKPNILTWYRVKAKGYSNTISRSNIKNNIATIWPEGVRINVYLFFFLINLIII